MDLGASLRRLQARPGYALAMVLMLGLGMGAATALYAMVNAVLYRSLPVRDPGRLVQLQLAVGGLSGDWIPYPDYTEHRDHNSEFSGVVLAQASEFNLQGEGQSRTVTGAFVSSNFFQVLGVGPAQGRTFGSADEQKWDGDVVLGHDLAMRLFGARPTPGLSFNLNGHPCVVAGVARKGFRGTDVNLEAEVWLPFPALRTFRPPALGHEDEQHSRDLAPTATNQVIARLKPGGSLAQAQAASSALGERIAQANGDDQGPEGKRVTRVVPLEASRQASLGNYLPNPSLLFLASALLLLLACANVANLQLADTARRSRDFAIRMALGAPRSALIRQILAESLLLALLGAALGLLFGGFLAGLLMRFQAATFMRSRIDPGLDARVAAFALVLTILCALLSGLAPAFHSTRSRLTEALGEGARGSSRRGIKELLVAVQIALALALLVASGAVFQSLRQLRGRNPGYDPRQVATLRVREGSEGFAPEQGRGYRRRLLDRVLQLPGVRRAALCAALPRDPLTIRIKATPEGQDAQVGLPWGIVGPGYFEAMGIPVTQGRSFSDQDTAEAPRVAVVSRSLARAFWPGGEAIGRNLAVGRRTVQVVGVVGDLDYDRSFGPDHPLVFTPMAQREFGFTCLLVKTEGDPEAILPALRRIATEVAPNLPIAKLETLERHLEQADGPLRLAAWLLSGFGIMSLSLAAFGVYSAQAFRLGERRRELSIRMALGASPGALLRLVLGDTLRWTVLGLGVGGVGAFYLSRSLAALITGVQAPGIRSYGTGAATLLAAVLAATLPNAVAAAFASPGQAMRQE
jgi:predicted permease